MRAQAKAVAFDIRISPSERPAWWWTRFADCSVNDAYALLQFSPKKAAAVARSQDAAVRGCERTGRTQIEDGSATSMSTSCS